MKYFQGILPKGPYPPCLHMKKFDNRFDFQWNSSLTHWGRDKMAAIFQTTFSNAFSWMKIFKFRLRFHWSLFPRVQLTILRRPGNKPLSEPMMVNLLTHIRVTRPQWVKGTVYYKLALIFITVWCQTGVTWTNGGLIFCRIYASLSLDMLDQGPDVKRLVSCPV